MFGKISMKQMFLDSLSEITTPDSMFVLDEGKVYMKFDKIGIEQTAPNMVKVEYYWKGEVVYVLPIERTDPAANTPLLLFLEGMEGRIPVKVTE